MAENKMEEVAKLLGVELEEEFKIYGYDGFSKITELGLERYVKERSWFMDSMMLIDLIKGTAKIIKLSELILDDIEKEYLSAVIKPFRNRIIYIMKTDEDDRSEFIEIRSKHYDANKIVGELIMLPSFKKGTMYKCMKTDKKYTLKELGL